MVVEQLTKAGFVTAQATVRDAARPERTVYALTLDGREELHDWMRELISQPHKEFCDFEAGLALIAVLAPAEAVELLQQRCTTLARQNSEETAGIEAAVGEGADRLFLVENEYRLALARAEQSFVDGLIDRIERDSPDFGAAWRAFHHQDGEQ